MATITFRPNRVPKPSGSRMNYNLQDQVISACNVPDFIGSNDKIIDVYHDRIPYQFFHDMCKKHFKSGPLGISRLQGKKMLAFVQDLFNGECDWCGKYEGINGARITEFTNVSNGYPVFYIEAYILDPKNKRRIRDKINKGELVAPTTTILYYGDDGLIEYPEHD